MAEPKKTPYSASIRARPRKDGTVAFDVRYRHEGASRTLSFDDDRSATKWASILRQVGPDEALRILNLDVTGTPTVSEYAERFIASKSGVEGKTLDHYRHFMKTSIGPAMGDLPLDALTADTIAGWVRAQADQGLSAKTIKNRHSFLSSMLQYATQAGVINRNPARGVRMPASEREEMVFLSPNEFTELLTYIPEPSQPLVLLLASTGLRWGEATALRWSDFDLDHGTVRVSRAWKSSLDKGWYLGAPKTERSRRTVSLPRELIPTLRGMAGPTTELVFKNRYGNPIRQQNFYEAVWSPARRLANGLPAYDNRKGREWTPRASGVWDRPPSEHPIGKMPRVHDLRHTHASWLIARGVPLPVIQRRLGHESITTTVDRYGHLAPDMLALAADATADALAGALPQLE